MSDKENSTKRRSILAAFGLTGAAAATLSVLPGKQAAVEAAGADQVKPKPERGGGYALTEHVKRYFETTRI